MQPVEVRCSALPLIGKCAAAAIPVEPLINTSDDASELGTAFHKLIALSIACRNRVGEDTVRRVAWDKQFDADELNGLLWAAWNRWDRSEHGPALKGFFPLPVVERKLEGHLPGGTRLTGHADVLTVKGDEVRCLDWKTGWLDLPVSDQLKGYAWLALETFPHCTSAYTCVVRVRDRVTDGDVFTRQDLADWAEDFAVRMRRTDVYNPGEHCIRCPNGISCDAKYRLLRNGVNALIVADEAGEPLIPEPNAEPTLELQARSYVEALERARLLESLCADVRNLIKSRVVAAGGRMPTGDGRELVVVEQKQRKIDARAGCSILADALQDRFYDCLRVSKGDVEASVRAPRGQKAAAIRDLMGRLEQAGAIIPTVVQRLEVKAAVAAITNGEQP
jgi:PD-(D/E)XK nuclease superfamily protein